MIANLLQNILKQLGTIKELRYVAMDWGQLDYEQPPVQWPCVLVDLASVRYGSLGCKSQSAEGSLSLTIAERVVQRTSLGAPSSLQDPALRIYTLMDRVREVLHAAEQSTSSPLVLRSAAKVPMSDLQVYRLDFVFSLKTEAESDRFVPVSASPQLKTAPGGKTKAACNDTGGVKMEIRTM